MVDVTPAGCWFAAANEVEELDEELMLSFRLSEADEEAIILRRFEVSVSDETKEEAKDGGD